MAKRGTPHFRQQLRELARERALAQSDRPESKEALWLRTLLHILMLILSWLDRILRPAIALAMLSSGFCLVMLFFYAQQRPQLWAPAERALAQMGVGGYFRKVQTLGSLVTRNAEITMVRDNMERLRLMLEAYPVEGGNAYPLNVGLLHDQAISKGFWNLSRNPVTGAYTNYRDIIGDYQDYTQTSNFAAYSGKVLYEPIGQPPSSYRIYACDKQGKLIQNQHGPFYLSNTK